MNARAVDEVSAVANDGQRPAFPVSPHVRALQRRLGVEGSVVPRRLGLWLPDSLQYDAWERVGRQLALFSDSSAWWLGDWVVYGHNAFGDRYTRAIEATSLDYQTLRNYAWVARRFTLSRRRDTLSFQHHAEVAALSEEEQEIWLDRAVMYSWPRSELRRQLRIARGRARDHAALEPVVVRMSLHPDRERRWHDAAERMASSLEDWIAGVVDEAASAVLEPGAEPVFDALNAHEPENGFSRESRLALTAPQ